jgi:hypothetical protein
MLFHGVACALSDSPQAKQYTALQCGVVLVCKSGHALDNRGRLMYLTTAAAAIPLAHSSAAVLCNSPLASPSSRPPWLALTLPRTGTLLCQSRRPYTLPGVSGLIVRLAGSSVLQAALRLVLHESLYVLHLTRADTD